MSANNMNNVGVDPNTEDAIFEKEVQQVKTWWKDSRWRYTKRPFTAEQIVSKRGNLKIEYPSNTQSKKLWNIMENRFKVCLLEFSCQFESNSNVKCRPRMLLTLTDVWNLPWSPRWPSTSTPSTSLDGNHLLLPLPLTSPDPIWLITHT